MMVWCRKEKKPSNIKRENQRLCFCVTWPANEMELVAVFVWLQTQNCTKRDTWRTYKSGGSNTSEKNAECQSLNSVPKVGSIMRISWKQMSVDWGTWGLIALLGPPSHLEWSTMPAGAKQPRHHTAAATRPWRVKDVVHLIWCGKLHKGIVWACYGDEGHAWRGSKTSSSHGRTVQSSQCHRREPNGSWQKSWRAALVGPQSQLLYLPTRHLTWQVALVLVALPRMWIRCTLLRLLVQPPQLWTVHLVLTCTSLTRAGTHRVVNPSHTRCNSAKIRCWSIFVRSDVKEFHAAVANILALTKNSILH